METYLSNLMNYSLQIAGISAVGCLLALTLRGKDPRAMLLHWNLVLVAALIGPMLWKWQRVSQPQVASLPVPASNFVVFSPDVQPASPGTSTETWLAAALIGGVALMLLKLAVGWSITYIYGYRAQFLRVEGAADLLISNEISGPATFGWLHPVILLPEYFLELPDEQQEAIIAHEQAHIGRRDWLVALIEEFIRCLFWFHPAVWLILGRIRVTREHVIDQEVVASIGNKGYLEALISIARWRTQLATTFAPSFLRRRHLATRVSAILSGVEPMSRSRRFKAFAASAMVLVLAAGMVASVAPMKLRAETPLEDVVELTIKGPESQLRVKPDYPAQARMNHVEGTVVIALTIDPRGMVSNAQILSGPNELRRASQQAVLQWQFDSSGKAQNAQVEISYRLGAAPPGSQFQGLNIIGTYPPGTLQTSSQELVRMTATLNSAGEVSGIRVKDGDARLIPAALEALNRAVSEQKISPPAFIVTPGEIQLRVVFPPADPFQKKPQ